MSRLRLIAGPSGSGKSSIFQLITEFKEKHKVIPTGPFVNSDQIEKDFKEKSAIDLRDFGIESPPSSLIPDYLKISSFKEPYDPRVIADLVVEGSKSPSACQSITHKIDRPFLISLKWNHDRIGWIILHSLSAPLR